MGFLASSLDSLLRPHLPEKALPHPPGGAFSFLTPAKEGETRHEGQFHLRQKPEAQGREAEEKGDGDEEVRGTEESPPHLLMTAKKQKGRPTKYKDEFVHRVEDYSLIGMRDTEIAGALKIDEATLYRWKNEHPEFCEAIKRGRDRYDTEVVEKALQQRAAGYEYNEEVMTRDGPSVITKRFHGSDTAAIFWLKNRQPDRWRDRVEHEMRAAVAVADARTDAEKARLIAFALAKGANEADT